MKRSTDVVSTKSSIIYGKSFPDPTVTPVTAILKLRSEVIPFSKSIIHMLESRCIAGTGKRWINYYLLIYLLVGL